MNPYHIIQETLRIFNETAIYLLLGFFMAGLLKFALTPEKIKKYLGKRDTRSVFFASLWGIPLPICSCGVLPTAISLQKEGAARGPTLSFLISTPETGVDSISVTYGLMDPLTTVFRPMAAFSTAMAAGILANFVDGQPSNSNPSSVITEKEPPPAHLNNKGTDQEHIFRVPSCCQAENNRNPEESKDQLVAHICPSCAPSSATWKTKGLLFFRYAYQELVDDIAFWLIVSLVIAGTVSVWVPPSFIHDHLGSGLGSMLFMLAAGIPLYVCATSSTPIAAALVLKGLNPGAALVLLLSGPATNAGALAMVARFLGVKTAAIYMGTIALMSLLFGFLLNQAYSLLRLDPVATMGLATEFVPAPLKIIGSIVLSILLLQSLSRGWGKMQKRKTESCC